MKKKATIISFVLLMLSNFSVLKAQEFIPLWTKGKTPNSKGLVLKDSISNERLVQVATPGIHVFP